MGRCWRKVKLAERAVAGQADAGAAKAAQERGPRNSSAKVLARLRNLCRAVHSCTRPPCSLETATILLAYARKTHSESLHSAGDHKHAPLPPNRGVAGGDARPWSS